MISGIGSRSVDARTDAAGRVGVGRRLRGVVVGQVDELGQRHLERVGIRLVPVLVLVALGLVGVAEIGVGNFERAAEPQDAAQAGSTMPGRLEPGSCDIQVARADRGSTGCGLSRPTRYSKSPRSPVRKYQR